MALTATLNDPDRGEDRTTRRPHRRSDLEVVGSEGEQARHQERQSLAASSRCSALVIQRTPTKHFESTYTPEADTDGGGDNGKILRVMVEYEDAEGAEKKAYKVVLPRRERGAGRQVTNREPDFDDTGCWPSSIPESAAVGTTVGTRRIRRPTPTGVTFSPTSCRMERVAVMPTQEFFNINKMNGQLTIGMKLNAERASVDGGDSYEVTYHCARSFQRG